MKVYWATKLRGFLRHISESVDNIEFVQGDRFYEISGKFSTLKSKLIRSRLLDYLGIFQVITVRNKECDCYGSFNRFLDSDKPYFIYLENPIALYHYSLGRLKYPRGKNRFVECLENPNLKYIVCMSEACRSTFEKINMPLPDSVHMKTIYPLVPKNPYVNDELIKQKCYADTLELLYCVQGKRFYTKGGKSVLEAVDRLQREGLKIHLTVITNLEALEKDTLVFIGERKGQIDLYDFSFSYDQMEEIYANTAVLLQPSSDESFGLTVLESMKAGCAILTSKLYAFPEMVENNVNGLIIDPKYWSFTLDNMPNPVAWGNRKKTRLSNERSEKYVSEIESSLRSMCVDRSKLYAFAKKSVEIADTKFGESTICNQWEDVWNTMKGRSSYET